MRKSITNVCALLGLCLGVALMAGQTAPAAPLLPKTTSSGPSVSAAAVPVEQMPQQLPVKFPQPLLTRSLEAAQLDGIRPLTSDAVVRNRRAVMSATSASRAMSNAIGLQAYVFYGKYPKGVYNIPRSTVEDFELVLQPGSDYSCNFGCVFDGNVIHMGVVENGYYGANYYYVELDANTGSQLRKTKLNAGEYDILAQACALDPTTGDVYGVFMSKDFNTKNWAKAKYTSPVGSSVIKAGFEPTIMGLGCDDSGQYWGLTTEGQLLKIDKTNGDYEVVAQTEVVSGSTYAVSGCVNSRDNTFIQSTMTSSSSSALYEVDLATGATTKLLDFATGYQFGGLHTWAYPEKAPLAPQVTLGCEMGSMDATVTMTMPTELFDGTPIGEQQVSYTIKYGSNAADVREGTAAAGATVTESITFPFAGMKEIIVYCHNDAGDSPKVKESIFVGKGTPKAPQNVLLTWDDGIATLTWDAVTEGSDMGYFNPDEIRYDITDLSGTLVKEDAEGTSASFEVAEPASGVISIGYKVKAKNGDRKSFDTASNTISLGHYSAPVTIEFTSKDIFGQHVVVDGNADGKTWSFGSRVAEYTFHSSNTADDWLFTPGIELTGGKAYSVKATAKGSKSYPEKMEIKAGQGLTADAMTISVADVMEFNTNDEMVQEGFFLCPESGMYNIGFHALSDPNMNRLKMSKYEVEELTSCLIPAAVADMSVNPSTVGDLTATITFTLPVKSILGDDLEGEVTYTLLCGDREVKTATAGVGEPISVEDTVEAEGDYTYTVTCSNATGTGPKASVSAFIGPLAASAPTGFTVSKSGDNTLHFTWSAVTTDEAGHQLPAENITYSLFAIENGNPTAILAENITSCEYDMEVTIPDNQEVVVYGLAAFNRGKNSSLVGAQILLGRDYEMPVVYTGAESLQNYVLFVQGSGNVGIGSSASMGITAADGDDSYFVIQNQSAGGMGAILTGNIAVNGESPMLSFFVYRLVGENNLPDMNKTTVQVFTADGQLVTLDEFAHYEKLPEENAWNRLRYSLQEFAGQTIRIRIIGEAVGFIYHLYDAVTIYNEVPFDLSVKIAAPGKVSTGETFPISVDVVNEGAMDVDEFSVSLLRNGELIDTYTSANGLAFDESERVEFTSSIGLYDDPTAVYSAMIHYEADGNEANNEASATVSRIVVDYPVPTSLAGENVSEGVSLTWLAPEIPDQTVVGTTETFESAESFADEYDGWLFIDNDQAPIGGFSGLEIPGHPSRSKSSFFIFDTDLLADDDKSKASFEAHSGKKYLACMYAIQGELDDWAVSPRLTGEEQEISFFARSYNSSYPEKIEVYAISSDDAANTEAYECVMETVTVPLEWTEYKVTLPAGTRHFAIRSCAEDSFMLLVDDVTFKRLEGFDGVLMGYNVYCDGARINDTTVENASHIHSYAPEGPHTYHVTAVYDKGESELSEPLLMEKSNVEGVTSMAQPSVKADGRVIIVNGAEGLKVDIYTIDGRTLLSALGNTRMAVAPAIYMVRVGTLTFKVIVR